MSSSTATAPSAPAPWPAAPGCTPATITGILDRRERGGWAVRERDPSDRRAAIVRALPDRNAELFRRYAGMNTAMDQLCADYDDDQLQPLADSSTAPPTPDEPPPTSSSTTNRPATETPTVSGPPREGSDPHPVRRLQPLGAVKGRADPAR